DFAVLKIDRVPDGLMSLPLDLKMDSQSIPKLSRFITLGFPLGSRTQEATVNVSVTTGHVRRAFENMLQVDASIYKGNSGGPIIDTRGKVIGIVSGVALDWAQGLVPMVMPRWDMGMVLPITKVVDFLTEIKAGQVKWNGVLDFSVETTLKKITDMAMQGRWADAQDIADKELKLSMQPSLLMAAGVMHFCTGDLQGARRLFSQSLSMDAESNDAKLMLSIIDWLADDKTVSSHRQDLLACDWRSPAEFHGYLVRVLEGLVDEDSALKGWYTEAEKSWLHYVVGLVRSERGDWKDSERLLREAVLSADVEGWEFLLARAKLEQVQKRRRESLQAKDQWAEYNAAVESFNQAVQRAQADKEGRETELAPLRAELAEETASMKDKLQVLEKIQEMYPHNRNILLALAFYSAADEEWPQALKYIRTLLEGEGRHNSVRMSIGLLKAGILHYQGLEHEARASLEAYVRQTRDPWYLTISEYLLGKQTLDALKKEAGKSPENLISAYTPLGFWAEGSGDKKRAIKHYKSALESFLDSWIEYDFAIERLKKLKKPAE
ncbi:MAG: trypsin-like peptidase domain-containing protein, partial [Deltaproteobacteria bacterium]